MPGMTINQLQVNSKKSVTASMLLVKKLSQLTGCYLLGTSTSFTRRRSHARGHRPDESMHRIPSGFKRREADGDAVHVRDRIRCASRCSRAQSPTPYDSASVSSLALWASGMVGGLLVRYYPVTVRRAAPPICGGFMHAPGWLTGSMDLVSWKTSNCLYVC